MNRDTVFSIISWTMTILYYIFWPLIKLFELTLPIWIVVWPMLKYLNPFFWHCAILHGTKWEKICFLMPYGVGGHYYREGYWCKRCYTMYCGKYPKI